MSLLRRSANGAQPATLPPIVHEVLLSPGQPLDVGTCAFIESRFGRDFSQVRVHTDARAAESAQAVNALAYTVGQNVVFGRGQYAPGTMEGRRLLMHELTHVLQQGYKSALSDSLRIIESTGPAERQADAIAETLSPTEASASFVTPEEVPVPRQGSSDRSGALRGSQGPQIVPLVSADIQIHRKRPPTRAEIEASKAGAKAEAVSKDYTDAQNYVTDFYSTYAQIHTGLSGATHRAIDKFTNYSTIPESRLGANVAYQLVRVVLGILPGASAAITLVDKLTNGLELAVDAARIATVAGVVAQRTAAGVYAAVAAPGGGEQREAAAKALDDLSKFSTEGAERIEKERREKRFNVEVIGNDTAWRGKILEVVRQSLGPKPEYRADLIQKFEKEYELKLYREYYATRASVDEVQNFPGGPQVKGVPEKVLGRWRSLTGTPNDVEAALKVGLKKIFIESLPSPF